MTSWQPYLDFAIDLAWQAGRFTLQYFQSTFDVSWKADESPVTVADRGAEELLRRRIRERYPDHAVVGEEFGAEETDATFRWILDPIDGRSTPPWSGWRWRASRWWGWLAFRRSTTW